MSADLKDDDYIKSLIRENIDESIKIPQWLLKQMVEGYKVELEHGTVDAITDVTHDDFTMTMKIVFAHLNENPLYYHFLAIAEKKSDIYWASRELTSEKKEKELEINRIENILFK
jgi:hypothetical protein